MFIITANYGKKCLFGLLVFVNLVAVIRSDRSVAATITVVNAGFEDISGETPLNEFTFGPLNGWGLYDPDGITTGGTGGDYFIGTLMPTPPISFTTGASEGQRLGLAFNFLGSGGQGVYGMQQTLAETLQPNTSYALQVDIGNIASGQIYNLDGLPGYRVDLLAGGVLLSQDNNSLMGSIPEGQFRTTFVSFQTGAAHAQLGQSLGIQLVNLNQVDPLFPNANLEVNFDNVRLTAAAVPEPATIGFFGLIAFGFFMRASKDKLYATRSKRCWR